MSNNCFALIVRKYGGIYVDIDAIAKRPFGPLFARYFKVFASSNETHIAD